MIRKMLMAAPIALVAVALCAGQDPPAFTKSLDSDQRILEALNRLTFGPRPGDVDAVKKIGLKNWIDLQLHPERIPVNREAEAKAASLAEPSSPFAALSAGLKGLKGQPLPRQIIPARQVQMLRAGTAEEDLKILTALPQPTQVQVLAVMPAVRMRVLPMLDPDLQMKIQAAAPERPQPGDALAQAKLYRAIESDRQLEEVLVDFWFNHFNVDASKGADRYLVSEYERDAIRPHVLGKFRDLLEATATSPAMMFYLDNWQSKAAALNENYARELMELHTLGVDGGYTQQDIIEVARCFTGWTVNRPRLGGPFVYRAALHDDGAKTVLGVTIAAGGGKADGEKVLDILARNPSTAKFISRELAQRFVSDNPPQVLVDRVAKTFRDTGGDIRAVLATLFNSSEFFSEGAYRSKIKSPLEMVASAVRATGAHVDNARPLVAQIGAMGEPLYRKTEPTGYVNVSSDWMSSAGLMGRMNFAMDLTANHLDGIRVDTTHFSAVPREAAAEILFTGVSQGTLDAIGAPGDAATVAGMLLGSPEFQRK